MPKTTQKRAIHKASHKHGKGTAGVAVKSNMEMEIVFTRADLSLLRKTIKILEKK